MIKEQKEIIIKTIIWFITLIIICIIGASNVLALEHATTYDDTQTYYDNNGSSVSQVSSTWNGSLNCYVSSGITTTANSYGAGVVINSPIPILTNHTYSLSFAFYQNTYSLALSSKNRIAIGNDIGGTAYNYANGNYYATMNYSKVVNGNILQFAFTASGPASYIFIPWTTASTNTQIYALNTIVIEDLGSSGGVSESTINNSLNNQTNTINNYTYSTIQNSQQAIIDNNNSNKQAIINNQNANNQALIDSNTQNTEDIIESQQNQINSCKNGDFIINDNYPVKKNVELNSSGSETSNSNTIISPYINIKRNTLYKLNIHSTTSRYACWYRNDKQLLSCFQISQSSTSTPYEITSPGNAYYLRVSYPKLYTLDINGYVCNNWQQEQLNEQNETSKGILGKLGDLLSYINPFSENFFVYKLIELLGDLLEDLFVPSSTFIKNWYDDFKSWFELKLGFLATPFTLFIDFIETFLNLEESNLIINIPRITVPNFEENVLIEARTFNWGELLNSKQEFKTLWTLYLDFIDVFLILNFLGLCETKYNRIFGGDTTPYEYYTTEETYNINDETGEATNHMLRQRTTRREKVK